MTEFTTTLAHLRSLNPCREGMEIAMHALPQDQPFTARQARDMGVPFDELLWGIAALAQRDQKWDRRLQGWLRDCATHAEEVAGHRYTLSDRQADLSARTRDFMAGRLDAAVRAAIRLRVQVGFAAGQRAVAESAARAIERGQPARWRAEASFNAARDAARAAEEAWQFTRLIECFEDP
jgi:hypothetical protein